MRLFVSHVSKTAPVCVKIDQKKPGAITFHTYHTGQSHPEPISHFDKVIGLETAGTQIPTGLIRSARLSDLISITHFV